MTAEHISSALTSMGSAFANHIWQSTVFAAIVGLLTMLLRKHQARIRFAFWLVASIKFLVPFSLLIALGGLLPKPQHVATGSQTGLYTAIDFVGQPFSVGSAPPITSAVHARSLLQYLTAQLPLVLTAIWFFGASVVLLVWFARWRRVSATLRRASPIQHGREIRLLRRLEEATGRHGQIGLRLSPELMEPGVFGIVRPVLIWPERLSEKLDEEQMEAILAHEMTHERRHDNLAAAIHMLVEILFWFHPMVWWMERRMVDERERACDEAVVRLGSSPAAYAESLLKACRFCVEAPLACVSGITGADLSCRVRAIMTFHLGRQLSLKGKLLLAIAAAIAIAGPMTFGVVRAAQTSSTQSTAPTIRTVQAQSQGPTNTNAQPSSFDVITIKPSKITVGGMGLGKSSPDGISLINVTAKSLIREAYGIKPELISGGPGWVSSSEYDIEAKVLPADGASSLRLDEDRIKLMLQSLLADRFKLVVHTETKVIPIYELTIAKSGPKLQEAKPGDTYPNGFKGPDGRSGAGRMLIMDNRFTGQGIPFSGLVDTLSLILHRTVVDKTGLTGKYDITLQIPREERGAGPMSPGPGENSMSSGSSPPDASGPSLFTIVDEQLGLKLTSTKGPGKTLVIDHIERPSEN